MEIQIPNLITVPFAENGDKNEIPQTNPDLQSPYASFSSGFPAITSQPKTAGGLPPVREDFNGVFNVIMQHLKYMNGGGVYRFNQAFCDSIGGYWKGAVLQADDGAQSYVSLIDNNTLNFNEATEEELTDVWQKTGGGGAVFPEGANVGDFLVWGGDSVAWDARNATTSVKGVMRIASEQEAITGTATDSAITPQTLKNAGVVSTIVYPNGGSASSPANVTTNQRYVMNNPYEGYYVHCEAQILYNNVWGSVDTSYTVYNGTYYRYGLHCGQILPSDKIVIKTGLNFIIGDQECTLNELYSNRTSIPCRVVVTRLGKMPA